MALASTLGGHYFLARSGVALHAAAVRRGEHSHRSGRMRFARSAGAVSGGTDRSREAWRAAGDGTLGALFVPQCDQVPAGVRRVAAGMVPAGVEAGVLSVGRFWRRHALWP